MKTKSKNWLLVLTAIVFLLLLHSCKKDEASKVAPTLTTNNAAEITLTSATIGGTIISDGGAFVSSRGVCWSTNQNPSITDSKTIDGSGTGDFTSNLTELNAGTTYYVRAYATNVIGTGYGDEISFTTADPMAPILTTTTVSSVTLTKANSGGKITSDGGASIIERGVCYGLAANPTVADAKIAATGTSDNFSISLTGLTSGTCYHLRAYASNSVGTSYGSDISFTTVATTVYDIDGNMYNVIEIGNQAWMKENLKTTKYNDGTTIPLVTDATAWSNLSSPGYCWYNNDEATYKLQYGALYNWHAINTGKLCPLGWHIPTDAEWTTLGNFLGTNAGGKLKATTLWQSPNTGATNETGFTAVPSGYRFLDGSFDEIERWCVWWTSTSSSTLEAPTRAVFYDDSGLGRDVSDKKDGFALRCIKD